jgi:hypothetical protein
MDKKSITCAQLSELEDMATKDVDGYHRLLEDLTGVKAKKRTVYWYFDNNGDGVGSSDVTPLTRMLKRAGVEITEAE